MTIAYLRVLGFLTVLTHHAYQNAGRDDLTGWPAGEVAEQLLVGGAAGAVDAFFVVTTYLASRALVRGALSEAPVSGRALLVRRASGLLPSYYLAVVLVWTTANPTFEGAYWDDLVLHLTFTHVFSDTYIFWTLGPAWFLAVSMQFYLLLAAGARPLQKLCRRQERRTGRAATVLAVVAGLVVVCWSYKLGAALVLDVPATRWSVWFGPLSRLDLLGMGIGLALVSALRPRVPELAGLLLRATALAAAAIGILHYPNEVTSAVEPGFWQDSVLGLAAVLVLVPAISERARPGGPRHAAPPRPVLSRQVGTLAGLSYGVYVWQEPILRALNAGNLLPPESSPWAFPTTALVLLVLSLLVAKVGLHLVEEPGRQLGAWSERRTGSTPPPADGPPAGWRSGRDDEPPPAAVEVRAPLR